MSKKKPEMKEFQLSVKIEAFYEVNVKAEDFHGAIEKSKNLNSYDILTTQKPFDSSSPVLWGIIDPSI